MLFIELFAPQGRLDADRRRKIAKGFLTAVAGTGDEGEAAPDPRSMAVFRSYFHVVVHEPETWVVGEDLVGADGPVPYLVRVQLPGSWRKDLSAHVIPEFTRVIVDADPGAAVQVQVLGVSEGSFGIRGEAVSSDRIVELMNEPVQQELAEGRSVVDPMCGVIVPLATAPVLEWEGTLYGFCCEGCLQEFVAKKEKEAARAG
ncbi:YHS domain-containing protein [Actinomadura adrarensis]|uniref:YHS domain-containing protein n=1 Tax=Actinomadura adrarensis TaxID=1819600 RepID=A0ABW3CNP3_9ACTN